MVLVGGAAAMSTIRGNASGVGQSHNMCRAMSFAWASLSAAAARIVWRAFGPPAVRSDRSRASLAPPRAPCIAPQIASTIAGGIAVAVIVSVSPSRTVLLALAPSTL